jgi:putative DNA primase/helicase
LLHNNDFTYPGVVREALETYKTDNSTVLTWVEEENITSAYLLQETTDKLFSDFKDWCIRSDIKFGASIRTFHKELEDRFNFERVRSRISGSLQYTWKFVVKLD